MQALRIVSRGDRPRSAVVAASAALILGVAHAAVSFNWALGSTALLDTIGGQLEAYGRRREPIMIAALWLLGLIKLVAAVIPLAGVLLAPTPSWPRRIARGLGWVEAVILLGYGGVLSVAGWLIVSGLLNLGPAADPRALRWHAFVWDPWFLAWGIAALLALLSSRGSRRPGDGGSRYPRSRDN